MKPVIVLVGRTNVGKSTLFNRLTRSRDALVADFSGLTRDRHYGEGRLGDSPYFIVDTGGFEPVAKDGIMREMARQTQLAVIEADLIVFLVDARVGLTPQDWVIASFLRKAGRPVMLVANKAEGMRQVLGANLAEFYELGLGGVHIISAAHGDGVADLIDFALASLQKTLPLEKADNEEDSHHNKLIQDNDENHENLDSEQNNLDEEDQKVRLAIVGRPNVGKSTLVNTLLGEERVIAFDAPGTTRDAIQIDFEWRGKPYVLVDTAGLRKRGKVFEAIEKFSVIKTLQAIEKANIVILLLDAQQDISEQDAHIAGFIVEQGRALVIGVNKWDDLDHYRQTRVLKDIERKLNFLDFAATHTLSAKLGQGITPLMRSVDMAYKAATSCLSTPRLTRALIAAVEHQQPQRKGPVRPKLRYAHQGGRNPPIVIIHGNALDAISASYKRYLVRRFRDTFDLTGTPLRIEFRSSKNPFIPFATTPRQSTKRVTS
jgi:GTPase